jgi:hypothetical protein
VPSSTWEHFEADAGDRADVLAEEQPISRGTLRAASLPLIGAGGIRLGRPSDDVRAGGIWVWADGGRPVRFVPSLTHPGGADHGPITDLGGSGRALELNVGGPLRPWIRQLWERGRRPCDHDRQRCTYDGRRGQQLLRSNGNGRSTLASAKAVSRRTSGPAVSARWTVDNRSVGDRS